MVGKHKVESGKRIWQASGVSPRLIAGEQDPISSEAGL